MVKKVSKRITEIMEKKNISREELAERTGLTINCIKNINKGTRKRLTLNDMYIIANAFGMNIKELL